MHHSPPEAACLQLEHAWSRRDFAGCAAVLSRLDGDPASAGSPALQAVAEALRPMRPQGSAHGEDADLAHFAELRAELMRRAGALDSGLRLAVHSEGVAKATDLQQWATTLLHHILERGDRFGRQRDGLWEDAAALYWSIGQLTAACNLTEASLIALLKALTHIDVVLNWDIDRPSILRTAMTTDSKRLRTALLQQVAARAEEAALSQPEAFIAHDMDATLLPALIASCTKNDVRDPNVAALMFFLAHRGALSSSDFIARVAQLPAFFISDDRFTIAAGENVPYPLCRAPARLTDGQRRSFHLSWWLDVNFPREQLGHPEHIAARLPCFVRLLLAEDAATLVLNAAGEASWFTPDWLSQMATLADALSIRPEQILYLPQNARFAPQMEVARRTRHPGAATRVVPFNQHLVYTTWAAEPTAAQPRKRFLCLNQKAHLHRTALLLLMHRDGLLEDAHVSFNQAIGSSGRLDGVILAPWMAMPPADIDALIADLTPRLPLRLDLAGTGLADMVDGDYVSTFSADLFADAAVYLVTETEMEAGAMCRFTEKTVKGLAAEIPFLLFGSHGALAALRELGFETFAPFIDESYDAVLDPVARFQAAYAEVRRLGALPMHDLIEMRSALGPRLTHNRKHLLAIGASLHNRLADGLRRQAPAIRTADLALAGCRGGKVTRDARPSW